jgi:hypothetical protein
LRRYVPIAGISWVSRRTAKWVTDPLTAIRHFE